MKLIHYLLISISILFISLPNVQAEGEYTGDGWRDKGMLLIYSPRYFGPSAFPIPELRTALAPSRFEVELQGRYHYYTGDKTKDLFARLMIPVVKERVGVEVTAIIKEDYKLTSETRDERNAVETELPPHESYQGDIIISTLFQVLRSEKWMDIMASLNFKTASGGRLCDARFTDAVTYWMDITIGKDLLKNESGTATLRMQAMAGFYCWMTNDIIHRQNDATSFGVGFTSTYCHFTLSSDLSGFYGYKNNGDRPLILRNNLTYEFKKNIISLRYNHGMKDYLYDNYSIGYIRCF
ncbi:MAG: hypothetical protein LBL58_03530 [Tannerellaceae bacterium]|jgi:hypothetical protein|nr:hypothetical protein [Tannerellaceae bacterium]